MPRREQDAIADGLGRLHGRVDRVGDAHEDALVGSHVSRRPPERGLGIRLTRELQEERPGVVVEERRQQARVVDVGAVRRVVVAARAGMHADALPLLVGEAVEHGVVQVDEAPQQSARRIELEREPLPP